MRYAVTYSKIIFPWTSEDLQTSSLEAGNPWAHDKSVSCPVPAMLCPSDYAAFPVCFYLGVFERISF